MHFFANCLIEIVGQRNENFEQAFEVLWNALTLFLGDNTSTKGTKTHQL